VKYVKFNDKISDIRPSANYESKFYRPFSAHCKFYSFTDHFLPFAIFSCFTGLFLPRLFYRPKWAQIPAKRILSEFPTIRSVIQHAVAIVIIPVQCLFIVFIVYTYLLFRSRIVENRSYQFGYISTRLNLLYVIVHYVNYPIISDKFHRNELVYQ
jgi:branched-subunit amino acid transport protein